MEFSVLRRRLIAKLAGEISINNASDSNVKLYKVLDNLQPPKILEFHSEGNPGCNGAISKKKTNVVSLMSSD